MHPAAITPEILEQFWQDPDHWSSGIYFCKQDPRLFVPKRHRWAGWTINFGHRFGMWTLIVLIGIPMTALAIGVAVLAAR